MDFQNINAVLKDRERVSKRMRAIGIKGLLPGDAEELLVLGRTISPDGFNGLLRQLFPDSPPEQVLGEIHRAIDPERLQRIQALDDQFPSPPLEPAHTAAHSPLHASAVTPAASVLDSLPTDPLPSSFLLDLTGFPEVQHQGDRNTCTAFSIAATVEYMHWKATGSKVKCSEEAIYWLGMQWDPAYIPGGGITLHNTFPVVQQRGVCTPEVWPYRPWKPGPPNFDPRLPWPQPLYQPTEYHRLAPTEHNDITGLKRLLVAGHAIAKNIPLRQAAVTTAKYSGHFAFTTDFQSKDGFHAVVLVGYRDGNLDDEDGGGRFLFRNSWGTLLPMKPEIQAGYFSVAYRYFTDPKTMPSYPSAAICAFTPSGLA